MNHESWIYPGSSRPLSQRCHVDVDLWTSLKASQGVPTSTFPEAPTDQNSIHVKIQWIRLFGDVTRAKPWESVEEFLQKESFLDIFLLSDFGVFIKQPTIRCCPPRSCLWALSHLTWWVDRSVKLQRRVARAKHGFCHLLKVIWRNDLRAPGQPKK